MVSYEVGKGIFFLFTAIIFLFGTNGRRVTAVDCPNKNATTLSNSSNRQQSNQGSKTNYNTQELLKRFKVPSVRELQRDSTYHSTDHDNLCYVSKQELDPRQHFKTTHQFFPARYTTTSCSGSIGSKRGYPICLYGVMDCVTIRKDISFMRMPSVDCSTWYHDVIRDVPVGCACMLPR